MNKPLTSLSSRRLARLQQAWRNLYSSDLQSKDLDRHEELVCDLYTIFDRKRSQAPFLIHCSNPETTTVMPVIFQVVQRIPRLEELIQSLASDSTKVDDQDFWSRLLRDLKSLEESHPALFENSKKERKPLLSSKMKLLEAMVLQCRSDYLEELAPALSEELLNILYTEFENIARIQPTLLNPNRRRRRNASSIWVRRGRSRFPIVFRASLNSCGTRMNDFYSRLSDHECFQLTSLLSDRESFDIVKDSRNKLNLFQFNFVQREGDLWWGPHSLGYLPFYMILARDLGVENRVKSESVQLANKLMKLAQHTFCVSFLTDHCFTCLPPHTLNLNENGLVHSDTKAAIEFEDGFKVYALNEIAVPKNIIEHPESVTAEFINQLNNVELRRILLSRFGEERFIEELGAEACHSDEFGTLYRVAMVDDEALTMVKVKNSTPEKDGSYKHYFLRVPPSMNTAKEAVAWTFAMNEGDFNPDIET